MEHIYSIREGWLNAALLLVRSHLVATAAVDVPQATRVSCGFPGGGSAFKRIGECWSASASKDGNHEIFVSPVLDSAESVLAVLLHEAIHAAVGTKAGHKGPFKRAAVAAGLTGKMTATQPSDALKPILTEWANALGVYPHGALTLTQRRKQGTRLIKCRCSDCGYTVRTTRQWLERGAPICPTNEIPMEVMA